MSTVLQPVETPFSASQRKQSLLDMRGVATVILSGGQGTRLFPLTKTRCKPAMCFGGRYRLIDVPVSNAINSGCSKIYIIAQFLSSSLHQHVLKTYRFGSFTPGFIELLSAEERPEDKTWFKGTADAVRQNLPYLADSSAEYTLILSGDQLYHMNFRNLLQFAYDTDADAVIAGLPVGEKDAGRLGIMQIDRDFFITDFCEKPQRKQDLEKLRLSPEKRKQLHIDKNDDKQYLGSMGIYLFKTHVLVDLLHRDPREDFGKHLIPTLMAEGRMALYPHKGYWEDIGTVESFYKANLALTAPNPVFNCYDEEWKIFATHSELPGPRICFTQVNNSILCDGSIIRADEISHSIIGSRIIIEKGSIIRDTYIMGNDHYVSPKHSPKPSAQYQIGSDCHIQKTIIDKHVFIGNGVQLLNKKKLIDYDSENLYVRDGIIIVPKGVSLPDGFCF